MSATWGPTGDAVRRFGFAVSGDAGAVVLDDAALALSAVLQPGLDTIEWLAVIDDLAASCPTPTREGVAAHLFGPGDDGAPPRFVGDREQYGDWRNSCLDRVLQRRRGIPITLSILMIEVARRLGVVLHGIGMPAHFVVGDPADPDWFCDPFHGGEVLDRDGARALFERITGGSAAWSESHLDATPNRLVIARMLNNLRVASTGSGDPVRLALVMRMRMELPEFAGEYRDAVRAMAVLN